MRRPAPGALATALVLAVAVATTAGCGGSASGDHVRWHSADLGAGWVPIGINGRGDVIVRSDPEYHGRSFVWHDGARTVLSFPGSSWVEAQAINDRGDVIGTASVAVPFVSAKCGHLEPMIVHQYQHHAKRRSDGNRARKQLRDRFRPCARGHVVVLRFDSAQRIADAAADEIGVVPCFAQGADDGKGVFPERCHHFSITQRGNPRQAWRD